MAGKNNKGRIGSLERDMEELKSKLESLTRVEKMVECLAQGIARVSSALEETNKSVQSIRNSNEVNPKGGQVQEHKNMGLATNSNREVKEPKKSSDSLHSIKFSGTETESQGEDGESIIDLPPYSDNGVKGQLLKLKGSVGGKEVIVLIKTGTTHNFISMDLVRELRLPLTQIGSYTVTSLGFEVARGDSICKGVRLEMPRLTFVEDYVPFRLLDNVDIILGTKSFSTLGRVSISFEGELMIMMIKRGKSVIVWKADPNL